MNANTDVLETCEITPKPDKHSHCENFGHFDYFSHQLHLWRIQGSMQKSVSEMPFSFSFKWFLCCVRSFWDILYWIQIMCAMQPADIYQLGSKHFELSQLKSAPQIWRNKVSPKPPHLFSQTLWKCSPISELLSQLCFECEEAYRHSQLFSLSNHIYKWQSIKKEKVSNPWRHIKGRSRKGLIRRRPSGKTVQDSLEEQCPIRKQIGIILVFDSRAEKDTIWGGLFQNICTQIVTHAKPSALLLSRALATPDLH